MIHCWNGVAIGGRDADTPWAASIGRKVES